MTLLCRLCYRLIRTSPVTRYFYIFKAGLDQHFDTAAA
jgi:hypothetical protein